MGFHGLPQPQFMTLAVLVLLIFASTSIIAKPMNFTTITKHPGCIDRCGNVSIPYPFGTTEDCYESNDFFVTCNHTFSPPKLFMGNSNIEIADISLDGQLKVLSFIARVCYSRNGTMDSGNSAFATFGNFSTFTVNNIANKFTVVGCDTFGYVSGLRLFNRSYRTGCVASCATKDDLAEGSCSGLGCCQTSIPKQLRQVRLNLGTYNNYTEVSNFSECGYAFVAEEGAFTFSPENITNLKNVDRLPRVVDWAVGNGTCEEARMNSSSYACVSVNSTCGNPDNGYGYRCYCSEGYEGNPYIFNGCRDIDECQDEALNICEKGYCKNKPGGFDCICPKGYHGDGQKAGEGCRRGESLVFKLTTGVALGIIILLLGAYWLHLELKSRKLMSMRQKWFYQNGGLFLQEELTRRERSPHTPKIFTAAELEKATDNFHDSMIIGQGGYGTVYKGLLTNNQIVAIKKSKEVDPNQAEQFANEVLVLSQINHRNVVKLLGICLETQVPLLVYEFINNGTLYEHIHNKAKSDSLYWDMRLKIATETAAVLSYLHSAASTPIIHRDVKTANILLDHTFTAKVSDFGASRLAPLDHMQLSTMVQGTFGYLDPEYMQSSQLTEKSDVYSFGVVLVELLTGMKPLSYDRPEEERNLASFFLSVMRKESLFEVVESNILSEGNKKQLMEVALLARSCLNMRGDDRPSMKEVAMELEGLRLGGKHSWSHKEDNAEEMESLLGARYSGFIDEGNSTTVGFDSLKDHMILPEDGGR